MVLNGVVVRRDYDFDLALTAQASARSQKQGRDDGKQHDEFHGTMMKAATLFDNHIR
jgi:hypothetical protein